VRKIVLLILCLFVVILGVAFFISKNHSQKSLATSDPISAPAIETASSPGELSSDNKPSTFSTTFIFESDIQGVSISNVNNIAISSYLKALNVLPLQNQNFVGDIPIGVDHKFSFNKIKVTFKDLSTLDADEKKDSNLKTQILLVIPNSADYFIGSLDDSNTTLSIPLYVNLADAQKSPIGADKIFTYYFLQSLYLNLQPSAIQDNYERLLSTFDQQVQLKDYAFKININKPFGLNLLSVPEAMAQSCSGSPTCGNPTLNQGTCIGGTNSSTRCSGQTQCPGGSCQGISVTCNGPTYTTSCTFVGGTGPIACSQGGGCKCLIAGGGTCTYIPPVQNRCIHCVGNSCTSYLQSGSCATNCNACPGIPPPPPPPPVNGACGSCNSCGLPQQECALINGVCGKPGYCGSNGAACNVEFNGSIPTPFTVGVPARVDVFVRGGSQWYDGVWGFGTCTDQKCTKAVNDPVLGSFSPRVFGTTPYGTTFTPTTPGVSYIHFYAQLDNGGNVQCQGSYPIQVLPAAAPPGWWQVSGGDAVTNQNLQSNVPAGQFFMLNGLGGFPGNSTFGSSTNLTKVNVSKSGWLGNTTYKGKTFDSTYFNNLASSTVTFNNLPAVVGQSDFDTGTASSDGYYYYKANGSLTINSKININGNRKIVLFVLGGNLTINNNINITNPGSGFFLTVVSGNINISPLVASVSGPALEGIYEADGVIDTGSGANVLPIRGTLVGWSGISFNRNLVNNTPPAETVEYDPVLTLLFPRALIQDNVSWQEVLP
jgi:hypothetical protein